MAGVQMSVSPINGNDDQGNNGQALQSSGVLPGLGAVMEVAGIESIPEAHQGPTMVGYDREEA